MAARNLEQEVDRLSSTLDDIRGSLSSLAGRFEEGAGEVAASGRRQARRVGKAAHNAADRVGTSVRSGVGTVQDEIEEYPLTSVGLALAVGFALGVLIRR